MGRYACISSVLALAALVAVSCDRSSDTGPLPEPGAVRLEVRVTGAGATKATGVVSNGEDSEAKVNTLQVLVFDGERLDGYGRSEGSRLATVSCTSGARDVFAVVNGPDLSAVAARPALLSAVCALKEDVADFAMYGSVSASVQADGSVAVPVSRLAARVVLRGIQNAVDNASLAGSFRVESVYLTNVTGDAPLGGGEGYAVSKWYNRRGYEAGNSLGAMTYDAVGEDVAQGATESTVHFFYSMPNAYPAKVGLADGETAFTPRAARLVLRVSIGGVLYDYPIALPALESNHSYEIQLVRITRSGNPDDGSHDPDDPDDTDEEKPVEGFEASFEVTVNPWVVVLVGDENGVVTI